MGPSVERGSIAAWGAAGLCALLAGCTAGADGTSRDASSPGDAPAADLASIDDRPAAPDAPDAPAPGDASEVDVQSPLDAPAPADAVVEPPPDVPPPPADVDRSHLRGVSCASTAPPGAAHAPPLPSYSGGTCPRLAPGMNTLTSGGAARRFLLVVPSNYDAARERVPLMFVWHHLGGSANSILTNGQVQQSADARRFISVLPERKGDLEINLFGLRLDPAWPYLNFANDARVEEEARFFDDVLACVAAQYSVNPDCVSTAGVSAGALWSAQLAQVRSERLSSVLLLSGGVGPATQNGFVDVRPFRAMARPVPMMVGWGGPTDQCAADFQRASRNLEARLAVGGNFVEECVHNCGHTVPPVDPAVGLAVLWGFALDHPYWLARGESPYLADGLPTGTPAWCSVGIGRATPRTGSCVRPDGTTAMACPVPAL